MDAFHVPALHFYLGGLHAIAQIGASEPPGRSIRVFSSPFYDKRKKEFFNTKIHFSYS